MFNSVPSNRSRKIWRSLQLTTSEYGDKIPGKYDWDQWEDHVSVTVDFGKGTTAKDIVCELKKDRLYLKKKSEDKPRIDVR